MSAKSERSSGNPENGGASPRGRAGWKPANVLRMNGAAVGRALPAEHQIVTEAWNRIVAVPYIVYMPERKRLLMLVSCDHPHRPMVLFSDDRGDTWSAPKPVFRDEPQDGKHRLGVSLTYLGRGRMLAGVEGKSRCSSQDYGDTWSEPVPVPPASTGGPWCQWDPLLAERDPATGDVVRVVDTGYTSTGHLHTQAFIRFSHDGGLTWSNDIGVPQWKGVDEVALCRARNGALVAACRTNIPDRIRNDGLPHYEIDEFEGLGITLSRDDGYTWTDIKALYEYGRHHPCMVLLPDGRIVMSHVVRLGYPYDENGFSQFGIEAIVSNDHGESWDLEHRYILARWKGNRTEDTPEWPRWLAGCQSTSTVLLPDGMLLTAYGTGYRSRPAPDATCFAPRDVGLVRWKPD